jgi:hypothetical protein
MVFAGGCLCRIVVLAGDGIGKETVPEGLRMHHDGFPPARE